jgi:hypothetical protein
MFKLVCVCLVATAMAAGESGTAHKKEAFNKHSTDKNHVCPNAVNCFDHETGKNFRGCNTDLKIGEVASRGGAQWCDIVKCDVVKGAAKLVPAYKNAKKGAKCHGSAVDWLDCEGKNAQACATEWTTGNCDNKVTCAWKTDNKLGNMHKYTANKKNSGKLDGPTKNRRLVTKIAPGAEGLEHQCLVVPGQQIDATGIDCECFCRPKKVEKWCKYTKNGDTTWDWRENRRAGDVHAKRMARGPDGEEKCRAKCNEMGDDKCYAFVYHKFGNCKFITKKSYGDEIDHCKRRQKSCIMNSGKGSLFHKC